MVDGNTVSTEMEVPANSELYALGDFAAGLSCCAKDSVLSNECNLCEIQRTRIKTKDTLPTEKVKIEVESKHWQG